MATHIEQLARQARVMERDIAARAEPQDASGVELAALLQEYRKLCEAIITSDFEYASAAGLETQLWTAHTSTNTAFRRQLRHARHAKDRPVEFRKLKKDYLHFIKASQRFYRLHILNLDAQFEGIPELRKIAHKWKEDASKVTPRKRVPAKLGDKVFHSCHQTLIQLGDLSRYRAMELDNEKDRNWGPAKGFYDLAAEIDPNSGTSFNQMAVMAREDNDYFRYTYYLYRSLACENPHPLAKRNLEVGFKKIIAAWSKGELINNKRSPDGNTVGRALIAWFVRLHGKCYKGEEFAQHDELEGEVLSHLAIELKERSLDHIILKIVLTNIAAEYYAGGQIAGADNQMATLRRYFYYMRLNVRTFFTLLQVLQPELDRLSEGDDVTRHGDSPPQLSEKISAVARRVLLALRVYSTWFTRYWMVLDTKLARENGLATVHVQELWKAYAATLTLLASSFPANELPGDSYMLEEDVETLGFKPLDGEQTKKRWYNADVLKQKWSDLERNHPNVEMLMRVRDFLVDGLVLTQEPKAPLGLAGLRFIYQEEGLPSELLASPSNQLEESPAVAPEQMDIPLFPQDAPVPDDQQSYSVAPSESASTTLAKDIAMNRMVDDLVGIDDGLDPLPEEDENIPPTPPEPAFQHAALVTDATHSISAFTINDVVNSMKNYKPSTASGAPSTPLVPVQMERVVSSSSTRQPAQLPSLPDGRSNGTSIWNIGTSGPASPLVGHSHDFRGTPVSGMRGASLSNHVRGDSSNSIHSNGWNGHDAIGTPAQTLSGGLGSRLSWGNPTPSTNNSVYGNGNCYRDVYGHGFNNRPLTNSMDYNMASPLLFGKYGSSHGYPDLHSSYHQTPPNGQGG